MVQRLPELTGRLLSTSSTVGALWKWLDDYCNSHSVPSVHLTHDVYISAVCLRRRLGQRIIMPQYLIRHVPNPTKSELDRAASLVVDGFNYDPYTMACVGGNKELAYQFYRVAMNGGAIMGNMYFATADGKDIAVALWSPPGQDLFSHLLEKPELGWPQFWESLSPEARKWWDNEFIPAVHEIDVSAFGEGTRKMAWHLHLFAVDAAFRGKGVGKALLKPVEEEALARGDNTTVGTPCLPNVPLYEHLGFEVRAGGMIPGGGFVEDFLFHYMGGKHNKYAQ